MKAEGLPGTAESGNKAVEMGNALSATKSAGKTASILFSKHAQRPACSQREKAELKLSINFM